MVIYSLPLAAVLVAAALRGHHHHTAPPAVHLRRSRPQDRANREELLALEQQLTRLCCRARSLRIRCALERGVVAAQLHDADAQLALAQLQLASEQAESEALAMGFPSHGVRRFQSVETIAEDAASAEREDETAAPIALQRVEDLIARKRTLVRRACRHAAAASDIVEDARATLAILRLEMDELQTGHHLQLSALYDALTQKRLCLRAFDTQLQKARRYKQHMDLTRAMAKKLTFHDDDEDASMAMLEDNGNEVDGDADALYDADADDENEGEDDADGTIAYEEASI